MNRWRTVLKALVTSLLILLLVLSPIGNPSSIAARKEKLGRSNPSQTAAKLAGKISETSPPAAIQELGKALEDNQPQVTILSPKKNEVLSDNTVSVRFQVKDLSIFKNEKLGLGPHLHVFLDNHPYQAVYDINQPLVLADLEPGTHTLRAFASRPWHESFKNDGAYAQVTFHVFAKTQENRPDPALPLLTYSRPQASYGAEPIMLDFYLTNAPLHLVAQESDRDDIADWRIRCTVNGESFVLDRWQPVYLKGFKPGKNWIQLEFLDEKGNLVNNVFNNTARIITYEPNGKDTLSRLMRGELTATAARGIVDPNYVPEEPKPEPTPTPSPSPAPSEAAPSPTITPTPNPTLVVPPVRPTPLPSVTPTAKTPSIKSSPPPKPEVTPTPVAKPKAVVPPPIPVKPAPEIAPSPALENPTPQAIDDLKPTDKSAAKPEAPKPTPSKPATKRVDRPTQSIWERFRKPTATPRPTTSPTPTPTPALEPAAKTQPEVKTQPQEKMPLLQPRLAPTPLPDRLPASGAVPQPEPSFAPKKVVPTVPRSPSLPQMKTIPAPQPSALESDRPPSTPMPASPSPSPVPSPQLLKPTPKATLSPSPGLKPTPTPVPAADEPNPVQPSPEPKRVPQAAKNQPKPPQWLNQFKSRVDDLKSNFKPEEFRDRFRRPPSPTPTSTPTPEAVPEKVKTIVPQPEATPKSVESGNPTIPLKPSPPISPTVSQPPKTSTETPPPKQSAADEFYERLLRSTPPSPTVSPSVSPSVPTPASVD